MRAPLRAGGALVNLEASEAERRIDGVVVAAVGNRMRHGHLVAAYDWDTIFGDVARGFGAGTLPDVADLGPPLLLRSGRHPHWRPWQW